MDAKIFEKIKKCLELSKSSNANEAAVALSKAKELMEKYDISMESVQKSEFKQLYIPSKVSVSRAKEWELNLACIIAQIFDCGVLFSKGCSKTRTMAAWDFIGREHHLKIVEYSFTVLRKKAMSQANYMEKIRPSAKPGATRNSYLAGFSAGIKSAVEEFYGIENYDNPPDIEAYIKNFIKPQSVAKMSNQKNINRDIANVGFEDGRMTNIQQGVDDCKKDATLAIK